MQRIRKVLEAKSDIEQEKVKKMEQQGRVKDLRGN
jgi:hypothetical protein